MRQFMPAIMPLFDNIFLDQHLGLVQVTSPFYSPPKGKRVPPPD